MSVAGTITMRCESCSTGFRVPSSSAGRRGKCPKCRSEFRVPDDGGESSPTTEPGAASARTGDGRVKFACESCGGSIKAPEAGVGKRVKCPRCQAVQVVPDPDAGTDDAAAEEDLLGGLGVAPAAAPQVLLAAAPAAAAPAFNDGQPGGRRQGAGGNPFAAFFANGGSFPIGCILSAAGAALGALIWYLVAYNLKYEPKYLAIGVGLLAGFGMFFGCRFAYQGGGMVAAAFSIAAIIAGKFLVFYMIVSPLLGGFIAEMTADMPKPELLARMRAAEDLEFSGQALKIKDEEEYERAITAAAARHTPKIAELAPEEIEAELEQRMEAVQSEAQSEANKSFFPAMFHGRDLAFIAIAMGVAFKVGSTGSAKKE